MASQEVILDVSGPVASIVINRPEKHNAITATHMHEIAEGLDRAGSEPGVRVITLSGAGDKAFCGGADVGQFRDRGVLEQRAVYNAFMRLSTAASALRKPLVALVRGFALGGGCALVAMSDYAIATEDSRFGTPEIKAGFFPMTVLPSLVRAIGPRRSHEWAMFGELHSAAEAERAGLVNRVVAVSEFDSACKSVTDRFLGLSPTALGLGRLAFHHIRDATLSEGLAYAREIGTVLMLTEDAQEGMAAFKEKRKPSWALGDSDT